MESGTSTVDPPSTSNGDDLHDHKKRLSLSASSSSSSDTSFIDLQVDETVRYVGSMSVADGQSSEEPSSGPTAPMEGLNTSLRDDSLKETPGGVSSGYGITPYRLPSSVFSRMKSGSPNDWSLNSNESLFSIYTGNTSFNQNFGKDGEAIVASTLSMKESTNPPPSPPLEHSTDQLLSPLSDSSPIPVDNLTESGEAEVVEIQAVLSVNADHKTTSSVSEGGLVCSPSRNSNSSAMSFAFPM